MYRAFTALVFDELCRRSGLTGAELVRRLREELQRPTLTRGTLSAWRAGDQDCPAAATYAVAAITGILPGDVATQLAFRMTQLPAQTPHDEAVREMLLKLYSNRTSAAKKG